MENNQNWNDSRRADDANKTTNVTSKALSILSLLSKISFDDANITSNASDMKWIDAKISSEKNKSAGIYSDKNEVREVPEQNEENIASYFTFESNSIEIDWGNEWKENDSHSYSQPKSGHEEENCTHNYLTQNWAFLRETEERLNPSRSEQLKSCEHDVTEYHHQQQIITILEDKLLVLTENLKLKEEELQLHRNIIKERNEQLQQRDKSLYEAEQQRVACIGSSHSNISLQKNIERFKYLNQNYDYSTSTTAVISSPVITIEEDHGIYEEEKTMLADNCVCDCDCTDDTIIVELDIEVDVEVDFVNVEVKSNEVCDDSSDNVNSSSSSSSSYVRRNWEFLRETDKLLRGCGRGRNSNSADNDSINSNQRNNHKDDNNDIDNDNSIITNNDIVNINDITGNDNMSYFINNNEIINKNNDNNSNDDITTKDTIENELNVKKLFQMSLYVTSLEENLKLIQNQTIEKDNLLVEKQNHIHELQHKLQMTKISNNIKNNKIPQCVECFKQNWIFLKESESRQQNTEKRLKVTEDQLCDVIEQLEQNRNILKNKNIELVNTQELLIKTENLYINTSKEIEENQNYLYEQIEKNSLYLQEVEHLKKEMNQNKLKNRLQEQMIHDKDIKISQKDIYINHIEERLLQLEVELQDVRKRSEDKEFEYIENIEKYQKELENLQVIMKSQQEDSNSILNNTKTSFIEIKSLLLLKDKYLYENEEKYSKNEILLQEKHSSNIIINQDLQYYKELLEVKNTLLLSLESVLECNIRAINSIRSNIYTSLRDQCNVFRDGMHPNGMRCFHNVSIENDAVKVVNSVVLDIGLLDDDVPSGYETALTDGCSSYDGNHNHNSYDDNVDKLVYFTSDIDNTSTDSTSDSTNDSDSSTTSDCTSTNDSTGSDSNTIMIPTEAMGNNSNSSDLYNEEEGSEIETETETESIASIPVIYRHTKDGKYCGNSSGNINSSRIHDIYEYDDRLEVESFEKNCDIPGDDDNENSNNIQMTCLINRMNSLCNYTNEEQMEIQSLINRYNYRYEQQQFVSHKQSNSTSTTNSTTTVTIPYTNIQIDTVVQDIQDEITSCHLFLRNLSEQISLLLELYCTSQNVIRRMQSEANGVKCLLVNQTTKIESVLESVTESVTQSVTQPVVVEDFTDGGNSSSQLSIELPYNNKYMEQTHEYFDSIDCNLNANASIHSNNSVNSNSNSNSIDMTMRYVQGVLIVLTDMKRLLRDCQKRMDIEREVEVEEDSKCTDIQTNTESQPVSQSRKLCEVMRELGTRRRQQDEDPDHDHDNDGKELLEVDKDWDNNNDNDGDEMCHAPHVQDRTGTTKTTTMKSFLGVEDLDKNFDRSPERTSPRCNNYNSNIRNCNSNCNCNSRIDENENEVIFTNTSAVLAMKLRLAESQLDTVCKQLEILFEGHSRDFVDAKVEKMEMKERNRSNNSMYMPQPLNIR